MTAGVAYTIASGRLFSRFDEFHAEAERLLGRPILTHEFAYDQTWAGLRAAAEEELTLEANTPLVEAAVR